MNQGWHNNPLGHRLASKGIKTKINNIKKLKIDMRKRFIIASDEYDEEVLSFNPLEYIEYLQIEQDAEWGKISNQEMIEKQKGLGKWVKRGDRIPDHYWSGGDKDTAAFELYHTYLELGMFDLAKNQREKLIERGFKFHEPISKTIERMIS